MAFVTTSTTKFPNGVGQYLSPVAGGAAGNLTVVGGITTADRIISVTATVLTTGVTTDLTSEFTITAANTINNTGGTATTASLVLCTWAKG